MKPEAVAQEEMDREENASKHKSSTHQRSKYQPTEKSDKCLSEIAPVVVAASTTAAAVGMLAGSNYQTDANGISRDFQLGGYSNGGSVDVSGGELTTTGYEQVDLGFASTGHQETHSAGVFSSNSEVKDSTAIGGFFSTEQTQSTSNNGFASRTESFGETTCCCWTVSGSEETECCTSDNCCGYSYELNCCGEGCAINCSSTCCFSPCIDACKCIGEQLPSLNDCGECCGQVCNACSSLTSCLPNLDQVAACCSNLGSAVGELGEGIGCLLSLLGSD